MDGPIWSAAMPKLAIQDFPFSRDRILGSKFPDTSTKMVPDFVSFFRSQKIVVTTSWRLNLKVETHGIPWVMTKCWQAYCLK
jgi:hypothetical protein